MIKHKTIRTTLVSASIAFATIFASFINLYLPITNIEANGEPIHVSESLTQSLWSDPSTWGGALPDETTEVIIPKDKRVVIDQDAIAKNIIVRGTLEVADTGNYSLDLGWLLVDGGAFKVGSPTNPFQNKFDVTIHDYDPNASVNCANTGGHYFFKNHFVGAYGGATTHGAGETEYCNSNGDPDAVGKISIHAADNKTEWTKLNGTIEKGGSNFEVLDATGWEIGDRIVLASTDYDHRQSEERVITQISGNQVTIDTPVEYMHFGEFTFGVDQRGEVANLSRNITFKTDETLSESTSPAQTFLDKVNRDLKVDRLHFMITMSGKAYIDGIEIDKAGQEGQLGKYPFHWHHAGDVTGQFVKNSVFNNSLNKCISVHVTDNATIENNIGYFSAGHCFYLEHDETSILRSQNNLFKNNISLETNIPLAKQRVKDYDNLAAGFWITHPNNRFIGNVAGGAGALDGGYKGKAQRDDGNGYWFEIMSLDLSPTPAITQFDDNTAHSNSATAVWINSPGRYNHNDTVEINNFLAYKNRVSNFWIRMMSTAETNFVVNNSTFADSLSGVYYASSGHIQSYSVGEVNNSLFVGETDNKGTLVDGYDIIAGLDGRTLPINNPNIQNRGQSGIRAIEIYDGASSYDGNTFINYSPNSQRPASIITPPYNTPWGMVSDVPFTNSTVVNSNVAHFQPGFFNHGVVTSVYHDKDGTLTGDNNSFITASHPTIRNDECEFKEEWNGYHCKNEPSYATLDIFNHELYRSDVIQFNFNRRSNNTTGRVKRINPVDLWQQQYLTNVTLNEWYDFEDYSYNLQNVPGLLQDLDFRVRFAINNNDWLGLSYPLNHYPEDLSLFSSGGDELNETFSINDVENSQQTSYFYDYDNQRLYIKLFLNNVSEPIYTHSDGTLPYVPAPPAKGWRTVSDLQIRQQPTTFNNENISIPGASINKFEDFANRNTFSFVCGINSVSSGNATIDPQYSRNFLYTPDPSFTGNANIDYKLCNENGDVLKPSTVETIRVLEANSRPEITIEPINILTNAEKSSIEIMVNDSNDNFDLSQNSTLEIKKTTTNGELIIEDDTIKYTPNQNFIGSDEGIIKICDNLNGCDLGTITLNIGNEAPVAVDDNIEINENESILFNPLLNDTDNDLNAGDQLSICPDTGFTNTEYGSIEVSGNNFTYTPYTGYFGEDTFTYEVCDTNGARDHGRVTIIVTEIDGLPFANDDQVITNEDEDIIFKPLVNDYSINGARLCETNSYTEAQNGTINKVDNTTLNYSPNDNYAGLDSFDYSLCDDNDNISTATIFISVAEINDDPIANPDTVNILGNEIAIITPIDNDTDVEGSVLLICEINGITQPVGGTSVRESDTLISYQPSQNETYTDTFTYQLCEEDGSIEVTGRITVNVTKLTLAPIASDDVYVGIENQNIIMEVLNNDSDADSSFQICNNNSFTNPSNGTITQNGNILTYTPNQGFVGTDTFTYNICDEDENSAHGKVVITINEAPINLTPVLQNQTIEVYPGKAIEFSKLEDITIDENIDTVSYTVSEIDESLNCTIDDPITKDTIITCSPSLNTAPGDYSFTITPTDESDQQGETAEFIVKVLILNHPSVELNATIEDETKPLIGQEVNLEVTVTNTNITPIENVTTTLFIDASTAEFKNNQTSIVGNILSIQASAMDHHQLHTLNSDSTKQFTEANIDPFEVITYQVIIIANANNLGNIRVESVIDGLNTDQEWDSLENYGVQYENNTNSTNNNNQENIIDNVTTTPRTGGQRIIIISALVIVLIISIGVTYKVSQV